MVKWRDAVARAGRGAVIFKQLALRPVRRARGTLSSLTERVPRHRLVVGIYLLLVFCMLGALLWRAQQPNAAGEGEIFREELALYGPEEEKAPEPSAGEEEVEEAAAQSSADAADLDWPIAGDILVEHGAYIAEELNGRTEHRYHLGIDIAAEEGAAVKSAAEGRVVCVKEDDLFYDRSVEVEHGEITVLYGNLGDISVREGEKVDRGEQIGTVGCGASVDSGRDEPYLHLEMESDGRVIDPLELLTS